MIPLYDMNNLTGEVETMFQDIMRVSFIVTIVLLTIFLIVSLFVWLFRSQKKI